MKHFTQTTANGLHTPPCGTSRSKSSNFILTSLLVFLMTFMGSGSVWADTYFKPGETVYLKVTGDCKNWAGWYITFYYEGNDNIAYGQDSYVANLWSWSNVNYASYLSNNTNYSVTGGKSLYNITTEVSSSSSEKILSFTIPSDGTTCINRFRIWRPNSAGDSWLGTASSIVSASGASGTQNQIHFSSWDNPSGTWETYSGGGSTITTTTCGSGSGGGGGDPEPELQTLTESYCLRGDLWLNGAIDPGWEGAGTTPSPSFTANNDNTRATLTYVIPAISEGAITSRITLHGNDHSGSNYKPMKTVWDSEHSNITQNDGWNDEKGLLNVPQQASFSPKKITLEVTKDASGEHLKGTLSDYTVKRDGWHLYVDNYWVGEMDNNGEFLLLNAGYEANSAHTVFVTNSKRDGEITRPNQYWSQGISWFGGLYIDKSNSNVSWGTQYKYYGDKFSNQLVFPTVEIKDARGRFKIGNSAAEAVKFTFDGGKITINTLSRQNISGTTYCLTGIFNSWNNSNRAMTWSNDTKAHTYTLTQVTSDYTKNNHGWKAFKIVPSGSWENQIHGTSATIIVNGVVVPYESGNECTTCGYNIVADNRILVQVDETSNITFNYYQYTGGINIVDITRTAYVAPVNTYTVTIHADPNNVNNTTTRNSVPEGSTSSASELNLSDFTYGAGTATWYTNEECTTPFSTVTSDMHLYAKWGIDYRVWLVGDLWMLDNTDWGENRNPEMTVTDGVARVTYIAPAGKNRFEAYRNGDGAWYNRKVSGEDKILTTNGLSWNDGHAEFTLAAPKKVTIKYDGKFCLESVEDYTFTAADWKVTCDGWDGNNSWSHSTALDATGHAIIRDVNPGTHLFKITQGSDDVVGQKVFNALYVDTSSPSAGLTWSSRTTNYGRTGVPQEDGGNQWRNCQFTLANDANAINGTYDLLITFDGGSIRCDVQPKHTVTFYDEDGTTVLSTAQVFDGRTVAAAVHNKSGYDFVKWHEDGVNTQFNFNTAITADLYLYGEWEHKHISSVSLNESTHYTWVGNSDFTLTLTKDPEDLIAQSVVWSSNNESVATVSDGTVYIQDGAGITEETVVRITCTVTDQHGDSRSAYCDVTVAPCEMTTDNLYNMTVTGYNSSTGNSATLTGLWNSSEPATLTAYHLTITPGKDATKRYLYADASDNYVKRNTSSSDAEADNYYWIRTNVGTTGSSLQIFTLQNYGILKNKGTNVFLSSASSNAITTNWGAHRAIVQEDGTANVAKWHFISGCGAKMMNMAFSNGDNNYSTHETFLHVDTELGNGDIGMTMSDESIVAVGSSDNCQDRSAHRPALEGAKSVDNPNYIASLMNGSYYRMNTNATVQANLAAALVKGAVISVSLYADAATSVKLTKTDGTEIATINLSADAALDYTYIVNTASLLLGESAFIIKAADNHAAIASISVSRTHAESPADPALAWDDVDLETTGITQSALGGNIVHTAASAAGSTGAISYTSSNTAVADIEADGTVLPHMAGSTIITATIEEAGCYGEASITYNITLTEPTLAERIAADAGEGITLTHNYSEDVVINKAVTINGAGYSIGNLTVQTAGDLTLSGALTVNDFSIYAKAGNTTTPAASGQVRNAANLTANGNAYFYYTVDPSGHVQHGWYDFTVPFRVNVMTGIKGIQNELLKENFVNETDYAIMEHLGNKQAAGEYSYKKFRGIMEPCRLYSITLDDDFNYNTIRFQKADGDLVAGNSVTLNTYASTVDDKHANWNGVGNGTLHHADAGLSVATIQVYQSGDKTFLPVDRGQYSLVVGSAFMVQQAGTMTLNQASHDKLLAPRRDASAQATAIQIAREGKPFSDQLYITADELAGQGYTQGVDVAKAGNIGNVNVPQIWTNAYNSKLCAHEAQLIDGEAQYTLSLYAPANGTYTLTSKNIPEGYTLYLTQNGNKLWDMSDTYVLDLTKGTTTEYGLLLVENYKMPTAVDNIFSNTDETTKIMRNGILYILQNGKVFNAQGARVK